MNVADLIMEIVKGEEEGMALFDLVVEVDDPHRGTQFVPVTKVHYDERTHRFVMETER